MTVTHGDEYTRLNILLYTILLVVITIIPYLTGMSGLIYLATALVLGAIFLHHAIRMRLVPGDLELPMRTFKYSITYLGVLFAALLVAGSQSRSRPRGTPPAQAPNLTPGAAGPRSGRGGWH